MDNQMIGKRSMDRLLMAGLLFLILGSVQSRDSFAGPGMKAYISPSVVEKYNGESLSVSFMMDTDVPASSFQFVVNYDPSLLALTGVTPGTAISGWDTVVKSTDPGKVVIGAYSSSSIAAGAGRQLAVLNFAAKDPGTGVVSCGIMPENIIADEYTLAAGQVLSGSFSLLTVNHAPVMNAVGDKTIMAGSNLAFNVTGSDPDAGDVLGYSASGLPAGATFDPVMKYFSWTPSQAQAGTAPYNVTFTVSDGKLSASASSAITVVVPTYTLSVSAVNGTVTKSVNGVVTNAVSFASGTLVSLKAAPNAGYAFNGWSGSVSGTANPVTIKMSANASVTANFKRLPRKQR